MNPFLITLILLCLLLLAASLVSSIFLTKRHVHTGESTPADLGLEFKSVYFPTRDGLTLYGWWIPSGNSPRTVIFLHGFSGSMDPDLQYVPVFHEHGFNVFMFDFRAHGRSRGDQTSLGAIEVKDVIAALDFVRASGSWSVGLLGFSMGGRAALLTAAKYKEFAAVVSDGGPLRLHTAISADLIRRKVPAFLAPFLAGLVLFGASLRLGCNLFYNDPLVKAKKIPPTPTMLIHGDLDAYTRLDQLEKMKQRMGGKVEIWRQPGARHCEVDLKDPQTYRTRLIAFFDKYLILDQDSMEG